MFTELEHDFFSVNSHLNMRAGTYCETREEYQNAGGSTFALLRIFTLKGDGHPSAVDLLIVSSGSVSFHDFLLGKSGLWTDSKGNAGDKLEALFPPHVLELSLIKSSELGEVFRIY